MRTLRADTDYFAFLLYYDMDDLSSERKKSSAEQPGFARGASFRQRQEIFL